MSEGASPPPEHAPPAIGHRLKPLAQRQPLLTAGAIPPVVGAFPGKFRDVTPRALPLSEPKKDETLLNEDGTVETNYDEVIESFDDMGCAADPNMALSPPTEPKTPPLPRPSEPPYSAPPTSPDALQPALRRSSARLSPPTVRSSRTG
jgi:hypothetical protein